MQISSVDRACSIEDCHKLVSRASRWGVIASAFVFAAAALVAAPSAKADTFAFSFSGGGMSGSGLINVSSTPVAGVPGAYQITGITGTFSDANAAVSFDNLLYPGGNSPAVCPPPGPGDPEPPYPFGGGLLDIYGMYFNVAGGYSVDLWSNGVVPGFGLTYGVGDAKNGTVLNTFGVAFSGTSVSLAVAPTPEPSTLLLLGTGALGFAGSFARRFRQRA